MKTICPHCDTEFDVQPQRVGTTMACPFCRESLTVDAVPSAELTDFIDEVPRERTKTCPMCGAMVPLSAGECRACGERLTPFSSTTQGEVWRDGKKLVLTKGAELPYRCIKTNAPADRLLKRTLYWYPVWVYVLLISPLIFVIVALIARKSAKVAIPVCDAIHRKRFKALLAAWICGLGSFGMLIAGFALSDPRHMATPGYSLV